MDLTGRKIDLTLRLYIDPADQDYLAARSAFNNCLFRVFYWCAAQACEKYLKAAILLQDRSAQDYGHDLASLFRDVRQFDRQGVIPEHLDLPETSAIGRSAWQGKPSALYVDYLAKYGSPDNRYAFHGTHVNGPVLHALDILCCAFRRLMRATNLTGGDLFAHQSPRLSHYQQIGNDQGWMIDPSLLLESLFVEQYQVGQGPPLRATFSNMNFAFFQTRGESERSFGGLHFHGSPLYNHLVRLAKIEPTPQNQKAVEQLREWASQNIYMTKVVRDELKLPKTH